ncbi:MAG: helix-hairpin-helix domain-containing protein, partial [Terracidiphilus sp.]
NGAVLSPLRILSLALVTLCLALPALAQTTSRPRAAASASEARVDINHASLEELLKAPGMTRIWATRIVRFRPYHAKNDLLDRGVVPGAVYDRIKDSIVAHRDSQ